MTIIYNKSTGNVILMMSDTIEEVSSIVYDIPDGYTVSSINVETGEPVLEAIPKTDEQAQIDALKEQVTALQAASAEQKKVTDAMLGVTEEESEETV